MATRNHRSYAFALENDISELIPNIVENEKVLKFYSAIHDKDVYDDGTPKAIHTHYNLMFSEPMSVGQVADMFHVPKNMIEYVKSTWKAAVQYDVHLNDPTKYQYDPSIVVVHKGELNRDILTEKKSLSRKLKYPDWYCDFKKKSYTEQRMDLLKMDYDPFEQEKLIRTLERNFKTFQEVEMYKFMNGTSDPISITFIWGPAGSGKSTFARMLCQKLHESVCVSSSNNDPLENYTDQDALILDDGRDCTFTYNDLLKVIDPNYRSTIKSRYHNKIFMGKSIYITSNKPLHDWYGEVQDDKDALYRRITQAYSVDSFVAHPCFSDYRDPNTNALRAFDKHGFTNVSKFGIPIIQNFEQVQNAYEMQLKALGITSEQLEQAIVSSVKTNFTEITEDEELPF